MDKKKCENCGKIFVRTPNLRFKSCDSYWESRKGCSRKCSAKIKFKYYPPYRRTDVHKEKMSESHKNNEKVVAHGRKHFVKINKKKKEKH